MDCVQTETNAKIVTLLTHTDRIQAVQDALSQYVHASDLFLPDDSFYKKISSVKDVEKMADAVFSWMKIKHKSITFSVDPKQDETVRFYKHGAGSKITLGQRCMDDPFLCGNAIAHAIIHHLLLVRAKIKADTTAENEALTDLGTVYAGLGILVLNGLHSSHAVLGNTARTNYISEFLDYVTERQLVTNLWQPYVIPQVIEEIVPIHTNQKAAPFIQRYITHTRRLRLRYAFITALLLSGVISLLFLVSNNPNSSSREVHEKRDVVNVLRAQVQQCREIVSYKQERWNTSDMFIQRQIDADNTRCESLQNRYEYERSEYDRLIKP